MDHTLSAGVSSSVIQAKITAKGGFSKTGTDVSAEQFRMLRTYSERKVREYGARILAGEIAANPYEMKSHTACKYCPYSGVCGYDRRDPGFSKRILPELKKEEVLERIAQEIADN